MISVILPFRNAEKFLEQSINSVLSQEEVNLELILVDNNSTDSSTEIANRIAQAKPNVKVLFCPEIGVANAFNLGFSASLGDFIARMDSDDVWDSRKLKLQLNLFEDDPDLDICCTQVGPLGKTGMGMLRYMVWQNSLTTPEEIFRNQFIELPICNPTILAKRKAFKRSYLQETYPEDYELFLYWMKESFRVKKVSEKLHLWRDHSNRLTKKHPGYSVEAFFEIKCRYLIPYINQYWKGEKVAIWGAGKIARRRIGILQKLGLTPSVIFDFKGGQFKEIDIIPFQDINRKEYPKILSLVSNRMAGDRIRSFLLKAGYSEMEDFILAG